MGIDFTINTRASYYGYVVMDCAPCDGGIQVAPLEYEEDVWGHIDRRYCGIRATDPLGYFAARSAAKRMQREIARRERP